MIGRRIFYELATGNVIVRSAAGRTLRPVLINI